MKGCLNFIRWTLSVILSFVLMITLSLTPLLVATSIIITNRENPKQWVADSGIYENAAEVLVDAFPTPESTDTIENPLDLDIPSLTDDLVTPEFAQETIEAAIDGVYDFLEGKTESLTFSLGLDSFQEKYGDFIGEMASSQFGEEIGDLNSLPACTEEQAAQLDAGNFEAIAEPCLPPNIDLDSIFKGTLENFQSEESFLPGEQVGDQFQFSPEINIEKDILEQAQWIWSIVQTLPLILGISLLVLIPLIIVITPTIKKGLNIVGSTGILVGLTTLGVSLLYRFTGDGLTNFIQLSLESAGDIPLPTEYIMNIFRSITQALIQQTTIYASIILGGAVLLLGIAALIKPKKVEPSETTEEQVSVTEEREYETKEKAAKEKATTSSPSKAAGTPDKSPEQKP